MLKNKESGNHIESVGELRDYLNPFTDECKLVPTVKIIYTVDKGEGFLKIVSVPG
jgi:hypothetical protein